MHKAGEQVKVPTYLVPATQKVWMDVYALPVPGCDGKTAAQIFQDAGCDTPASPSCAACLGGPKDTYARMNKPEVCVSTTNRSVLQSGCTSRYIDSSHKQHTCYTQQTIGAHMFIMQCCMFTSVSGKLTTSMCFIWVMCLRERFCALQEFPWTNGSQGRAGVLGFTLHSSCLSNGRQSG